MFKKLVSMLLVTGMVVTLLPGFHGQTVKANEIRGGYVAPEIIEIELSEDEILPPAEEINAVDYPVGELGDTKYWDSFTNWYYYGILNARQKALYMDAFFSCRNYLTSLTDVTDKSDTGVYRLPRIDVSGLTKEEISFTLRTMADNCPQYWFLGGVYTFYSRSNEVVGVSLSVREEGVSGAVRAKYTELIKEKLDGWLTDIKTEQYYNERLKKCYDTVLDNVEYAYDDLNNNDTMKHQSVFTAITTGKTVCAGYAELFAMLCNAAGINCITVTSDNHEWCQVRYKNNWYNADPTWDDPGNGGTSSYRWYLKSDANFQGQNEERKESHVPEDKFKSIRPTCCYDWNEAPELEYTEVYRLYNSKDHRHFNTAILDEANELKGQGAWDFELSLGMAGTGPESGDPVYLLRQVSTGKKLYTSDLVECSVLTRDGKYVYEYGGEPAFYSVDNGGTPVFRLFNPKSAKTPLISHHYTSDLNEIQVLLGRGWVFDNNSKPIYRLLNLRGM